MQKAEEFYKKLVDDNFAESLQSAKKATGIYQNFNGTLSRLFCTHALYAENVYGRNGGILQKSRRKYV